MSIESRAVVRTDIVYPLFAFITPRSSDDDHAIFLDAAMKRLGATRVEIEKLMDLGVLPAPAQHGRKVAWRTTEIRAAVQQVARLREDKML